MTKVAPESDAVRTQSRPFWKKLLCPCRSEKGRRTVVQTSPPVEDTLEAAEAIIVDQPAATEVSTEPPIARGNDVKATEEAAALLENANEAILQKEFSLLTVNTIGLGKGDSNNDGSVQREAIFASLQEMQPDVVFFQGTQFKALTVGEEWSKVFPDSTGPIVRAAVDQGGVAIMFAGKHKTVESIDFQAFSALVGHCATALIDDKLLLVNVHAPASTTANKELRKTFFEELLSFLVERRAKNPGYVIIVGGDFNAFFDRRDQEGGKYDEELWCNKDFLKLASEPLNLRDAFRKLHLDEKAFTSESTTTNKKTKKSKVMKTRSDHWLCGEGIEIHDCAIVPWSKLVAASSETTKFHNAIRVTFTMRKEATTNADQVQPKKPSNLESKNSEPTNSWATANWETTNWAAVNLAIINWTTTNLATTMNWATVS